ncbi:DUF3553 domain-containing protein [Phycisphaera mikurensis]|uniref:DUF3553 domain-containing protein n=1 Tax=Phycisphaera mikurensis (strain NBRC 102666 / KCTC 22515 / FYK2301M01) TaxID=1142394 RepID=I0IHW0_PHYMF|nr:DUF3553 domain-containing protein [Phycisphaera mikurensis]MBB6441089.1 hypothetical protein [Phycisphaera mikurensis]BAM04848.1 hypothetical protein PSMK_26890 [Phycisphaera mikurensis NBRC 102666]
MNPPFEKGDRVRHPKRPEWGSGTVRDTQATTHNGAAAQKLTIDFANRGRAVINTAVAPLEKIGSDAPAGSVRAAKATTHRGSAAQLWSGHPERLKAASAEDREAAAEEAGTALLERGGRNGKRIADQGWLDELESGGGSGGKHELWELPDAMTDPFIDIRDRLRNTLLSYRFTEDPRSIIEWATSQTGLDDPLTRYTRHEMEQAFPRFCRDRDNHFRKMAFDLKKKRDARTLKSAMKGGLPPAGQSAVDKALKMFRYRG